MRDAAAHLAVDHHRIDQGSGVLQRHVVEEPDAAGLEVDLDLGDVAGIGIGERIGAPIDVGLEAGIDVRREAVAGRALEDARELAELDRKLRRADHAHLAVDELEVVLGRFSTWLASFFALSATARAASSTDEPAVTVWRLAKAPSPSDTPPVSPGTTVMSSRAQAELAGANLRQRGAQPLPDRGGAGEHRYAPGVRHPHQAGLERPAPGALDAVRQPDADIAALRSRGGLAARESRPSPPPASTCAWQAG